MKRIMIIATCKAHSDGDYEIVEQGPKWMEQALRQSVNSAIFSHMRKFNCDGKKIEVTTKESDA